MQKVFLQRERYIAGMVNVCMRTAQGAGKLNDFWRGVSPQAGSGVYKKCRNGVRGQNAKHSSLTWFFSSVITKFPI